jgi:hypothetical protein
VMPMSEFDVLRLCRVDGLQPTARERWTAFWRLWRLAARCAQDAEVAGECFRVLMSDWSWVQLAQGHGDYYARKGPPFLRKLLLGAHR